MPYDQEVVDGVKEILALFNDPSINQELNRVIAGRKQKNHELLNALADILEHKYLVVHSMEQSILGTMSKLGLSNEIRISDEDDETGENDYVINAQTVAERDAQLTQVRNLVAALREDAIRCEEYDKTRTQ